MRGVIAAAKYALIQLRANARNQGIGEALMQEVKRQAIGLDVDEIQWLTPNCNVPAQRFYDRLGASATLKSRYTWQFNKPQTSEHNND